MILKVFSSLNDSIIIHVLPGLLSVPLSHLSSSQPNHCNLPTLEDTKNIIMFVVYILRLIRFALWLMVYKMVSQNGLQVGIKSLKFA